MNIPENTVNNIAEAVKRTLNGENELLRVIPVESAYRIVIGEDEDGYDYYGGEDARCFYDTWQDAYDALLKNKVQPLESGYMPKIVCVGKLMIVTEKEIA